MFKVLPDNPRHLDHDTLAQALTRLGLQQYSPIFKAENLDLESLVKHKCRQKKVILVCKLS